MENLALTGHLSTLWSKPEAASAKDAVAQMLETPGWKFLTEAVEARLRHEQQMLMQSVKPSGDDTYDRIIGKWAGLRSLEGLAKGIVDHGKAAEAEMRRETEADTG